MLLGNGHQVNNRPLSILNSVSCFYPCLANCVSLFLSPLLLHCPVCSLVLLWYRGFLHVHPDPADPTHRLCSLLEWDLGTERRGEWQGLVCRYGLLTAGHHSLERPQIQTLEGVVSDLGYCNDLFFFSPHQMLWVGCCRRHWFCRI